MEKCINTKMQGNFDIQSHDIYLDKGYYMLHYHSIPNTYYELAFYSSLRNSMCII